MNLMRTAALLLLATTLMFATDIRLVASSVNPSEDSSSTATGLEVGFLSSKRTNGIVYAVKLQGMLNDFEVNNGGYAAIDFEFIYRSKHKIEPYVLIGGVYKSVNDYDNASGLEGGIGMRYIWCNGFHLGVEGKGQHLSYESGQPNTAYRDGDTETTAVFSTYAGWRF